MLFLEEWKERGVLDAWIVSTGEIVVCWVVWIVVINTYIWEKRKGGIGNKIYRFKTC